MNMLRRPARGVTLVSLVTVPLFVSPPAAAKDRRDLELERALRKATRRVHHDYAKDLGKVATWAAREGLRQEAEKLLGEIEKLAPDHDGLEKLRSVVESATDADEEAAEKTRRLYQKKLAEAREDHAGRLFSLAKKCIKVGLFCRAYEMCVEAAKSDPDHSGARSALSYRRDRKTKAWITKWEYDQKYRHRRFLTDEGWIAEKDRKRWEKGLRPYKGKWITEEEEKRLRTRNEYNPYRVESEHFEVRTNLGRTQAWQFAMLLEGFYREFFRVFVGFFDQKAGAKLLFNQANLRRKHLVYVYPSRNDYLTHVKAEHGNNKLARRSAGFYTERCKAHGRSSHFYWSDNLEAVYNTLYHEVTHQLFDETKERKGGSSGNNWVVEGVAVYAETWTKAGGEWKPGANIEASEIQMAKAHLEKNPDWSLASFVGIGHKQFHEEPGRSLNYALAGSLAHFFMHHDDEVYREDFVGFLSDYYGGKVREDSLAEAIKLPGDPPKTEKCKILERQFMEYMSRLGEGRGKAS